MHEGAFLFLPHMKGVWIRENHGADEKFDLGLERRPVLQVKGIVLGKGMEAYRLPGRNRNS